MRQKDAILLDNVDRAQGRNCQVRLTHALRKYYGTQCDYWDH